MKMVLGERGILQVPADKGYGAVGAGGAIPPNADLYFDVELLAINGKAAPEKLPEQGYSGKKVAHEDMKTCTGDWRREYGPKMGEEPEKAAPKAKKSGSTRLAISWGVMAIFMLVC